VTVPAPSVDDSLGLKLLPAVLSMVAGSADDISFLGLHGLFVAHITGNLVTMAAHIVSGSPVGIAEAASVPVFVLVLVAVRLLAARLRSRARSTLVPLLALQLALLAGYLALSLFGSASIKPTGDLGSVAGMCGVSAMAVQNALVQLSLRDAPTTAVLTTDLTRFTMNLGDLLLDRDPAQAKAARRSTAKLGRTIISFAAGATLGAALFKSAGLEAIALPTALAALALASGIRAGRDLQQPTGSSDSFAPDWGNAQVIDAA
jgi:uncharacterized membrane protein YoaK (UPF0700 family)